MDKLKKKIYYGWWIVAAGFLLSGVNVGIHVNCGTAFINPVCSALGIKVSAFAASSSIMSLVAIPCLLVIPRILQRVSAKRTVAWCGGAFLLFKLLFACSGRLWQFYLCSLGIGISAAGIGYLTVNSLLNDWFEEKSGLVTGIASSGAGIVGAAALPLVNACIGRFGWRFGYFAEVMICALFVVISVCFVREKEPGLKKTETGRKEKSVLYKPSFYFLLLGLFLTCLVGMGVQPYLMPSLEQAGYTVGFAAFLTSMILMVNTAAKVIMGGVYDKAGVTGSCVLTGVLMAAALVFLLLGQYHFVLCILFGITFAFAYVNLSVPAPWLTKELYGKISFTDNYSLVMIITSLGGAAGNMVTGLLYEKAGGYRPVWFFYIILSLLSMISLLLAAFLARREKER